MKIDVQRGVGNVKILNLGFLSDGHKNVMCTLSTDFTHVLVVHNCRHVVDCYYCYYCY
jgi:hypothetical protein